MPVTEMKRQQEVGCSLQRKTAPVTADAQASVFTAEMIKMNALHTCFDNLLPAPRNSSTYLSLKKIPSVGKPSIPG